MGRRLIGSAERPGLNSGSETAAGIGVILAGLADPRFRARLGRVNNEVEPLIDVGRLLPPGPGFSRGC